MKSPIERFFRRQQKKLVRFFEQVGKGDKLSIAILVCAVLLVVVLLAVLIGNALIGDKPSSQSNSGSHSQSDSISTSNSGTEDTSHLLDTQLQVEEFDGTVLIETDDAGKDYLKETLFIGDSNTARMSVYDKDMLQQALGVVSMGIQHVTSSACLYFKEYSDPITVPKAVSLMQPRRIVINYGTNNTAWDTDTFIKSYGQAIDAIQDSYEYADIIIAAVLPVARNRSYPDITMEKINAFNTALAQLAKDKGCYFLNSTEVMADSTGYANSAYMIEDGIHLSTTGLDVYYDYVRTHALLTEDTRPAVKNVPTHKGTPDTFFGGATIPSDSNSNSNKASFTLEGADLTVGATAQLNATNYLPSYSAFAGKTITWSSSDTSVATVDQNGVVKGIAVGKSTISCKIGDVTETVVVTVKDAPTTLTITGATSVEIGKTTLLAVSIPETYKGAKSLVWTSSNPAVATVDSKTGVITGVAEGIAVITVKMDDSITSNQHSVTVKKTSDVFPTISISAPSQTVVQNQTLALSCVIGPEEYKGARTVVWVSSDPSVAIINANTGVITAASAGTVTITATVDGKASAQLKITVTAPAPPSSSSDPEPPAPPSSSSEPEPPAPPSSSTPEPPAPSSSEPEPPAPPSSSTPEPPASTPEPPAPSTDTPPAS